MHLKKQDKKETTLFLKLLLAMPKTPGWLTSDQTASLMRRRNENDQDAGNANHNLRRKRNTDDTPI
jgi:hypothetical protein